jgi:low temperature requirement protein LtrA
VALGHARPRQRAGEEQRATALELFFEVVFVFAVTQLSRYLLHHLTVQGAAQTLFLLICRVVGVDLHHLDDQLV